MSELLYSHEEMLRNLQMLCRRYRPLAFARTTALTRDGRAIVLLTMGNPRAKKHLLIQASIHGREYVNSLLVMKQAKAFLEGYPCSRYLGISYKELLNSVCFHILPMTNPDGAAICQQGPRAIRNSALRQKLCAACRGIPPRQRADFWKRWKANVSGVDLNRNFSAGWQEYQGAPLPGPEKYKGPHPASEPETRAILAAAREVPVCCVISLHSSGNLIYWDYGSSGNLHQQETALARMLSAATGYPAVSVQKDSADAAGCSDYFVRVRGIPAATIENGAGPAPVGREEFPALWAASRKLLPALAHFYTGRI